MAKSNATIVAIVGVPGAGKTLAADFFKNKVVPVLRFGTVTDEGLKDLNLVLNEENERMFREKLRKDLGMAAFAIKMEPKILEATNKHQFVVLDGLRSWEEYVYLKKKFANLILLAIYASPQIRYQRLSERKIRPLTTEEARERDVAELINLHMGPPIAIADYLIKNEGSIEHFYHQLQLFKEQLK